MEDRSVASPPNDAGHVPGACIITMHGVGVTGLGSTLRGLARYYSERLAIPYEHTTISIDGHEFAVRRSSQVAAPELIEVNWTDVQRPARNWFSLLGYIARVLIASLHLAENWNGTTTSRRWIIRVYRMLFEAIALWKVPCIIYVMLLVAAPQNLRAYVAAAGSAIVMFAAWKVRRWSTSILIGGILFSGYYAILGWRLATSDSGLETGTLSLQIVDIIKSTSLDYITGHRLLPFVVLLLTVTILWPEGRKSTMEQRLARLGLAYSPLIAVALIGACLWVLAIPLANAMGGNKNYTAWQRLHSAVLVESYYDLRKVELTHLAALATFGLFALSAAALYVLRRWCMFYGKRQSGLGSRNVLPWLCRLIPIGALVVGFSMYADFVSKRQVPSADVFDVYRISALRVLPFLPWLLTPLVIILDVLGDVVFTSLRKDEHLGIGTELESRLRAALKYARSIGPRRIVILSHSLGTVVAAQVLCTDSIGDVRLITTGSPISTLHGRFLRWNLHEVPGFIAYPKKWENIWRDGDYVGGAIEGPPSLVQQREPDGGHVGYWTDPVVLDAVNRAVDFD